MSTREAVIPPAVKLQNKTIEKRVQLILYNYKLRAAVAEFRKRWWQNPESAEESVDKLLFRFSKDPDIQQEAAVEVREMMTSSIPDLPVSYFSLIWSFAVEDNIDVRPAIIVKGGKDDLEAVLFYLKVMGEAVDERVAIGPYVVEVSLDNRRQNQHLLDKMTEADKDNANAISELINGILRPHNKRFPNNVKLMSRISDLRRAGESYAQIMNILHDEGFPLYDPGTLKTYARRAKQLGL